MTTDARPSGLAGDTPDALPVGSRRLWVGVLVAPAAWVLAEGVGYYLAARSCEPGPAGVPLAGTAYPAVTQVIVAIVMLAAAIVGLSSALSNWRAIRPRGQAGDYPIWGRAHFMAFGGVLVSALFAGGIVLFGLAPFFVNACSQAR